MSTVIRLKDVSFGDSSLPVVAPLVRDGLVGAWRFNKDNTNAFVDLSGNGHALVNASVADWGDNGVVVNPKTLNTGIYPDVSWSGCTLFAVAKVSHATYTNDNFILGSWRGADPGLLLMAWDIPLSNDIKIVPTYKSSPDGGGKKYTNQFVKTYADKRDYYFAAAITVSGSETNLYIPALSDQAVRTDALNGDWFKGTNQIIIGGAGSAMEVVEALIYNKALNADQIKKQYMLSRSALSAAAGIVL